VDVALFDVPFLEQNWSEDDDTDGEYAPPKKVRDDVIPFRRRIPKDAVRPTSCLHKNNKINQVGNTHAG